MERNSSLEDFEKALVLLDNKLEKLHNVRIKIRAIGGFAMMYQGIRKNGYTIDIDSLTFEFDDKVCELIKEVGAELGLENDWLNTDCSMLDGFLDELAPVIIWEDTKYEFNNIDLKVADIWGLIESKAKAIHDGGLVPRSTDKKDLLALLRYIDIYSVEQIDMKKELERIRNKYPRCYDYLNRILEW